MTVPPQRRALSGSRPASPSVSVLIPADDLQALPLLLGTLPPVDEVVVVVGRDAATGHALPRAARVIRQTRTGVGNALACGVAASTGDIVVTLPGNGSCDPAEMPLLIEALRSGADVVHGSRRLAGAGGDQHDGLLSRWTGLVLLWFVRVLFGCRPTDPGFGYRAFWRDTAGRLGLPRVAGTTPVRGDGPEIEALLTVRTALAGLRGAEVPATAYPGAGGASAAALVPAIRALFAEYAERRRSAGAAEPENFVLLTGPAAAAPGTARPAVPARPPTAAGSRTARPGADFGTTGTAAGSGAPLINEPHTAIPRGGYPADGRGRRWPAPNDRRRAGGPDHPNSGSLPGDPGFVERRRGERGALDRRTSRGAGTPDPDQSRRPNESRSAEAPAGDGRPDEEFFGRRRWRDNRGEAAAAREAGAGRRRGQGRPNLRVINGEGTGNPGNRGGHLRSV